MLKIRLRRIGRTHEPFYRIVVTEKTSPVQGKFIAQIGHYNPKSKELTLKNEEAIDWMNKGAKPSNTVAKLMKKEKLTHKSIVVHKTPKISKKQLEAQKIADEQQKSLEHAEKEKAKQEWEKEAAQTAQSHESSDEKLVEQIDQPSEDKPEEAEENTQEKTEEKPKKQSKEKPEEPPTKQ